MHTNFHENLGKTFFWLIVEWLLNNQGKNKDEKILENKYNFWAHHPEVRLCTNFHESPRKFFLTLDWFSTNWGKSKNEDEEIWEIFELSKSILGYAWPFMKIWEKEIWLAFHWFLTVEKWRWRWKNFRKWVLFLNSPLET